MKARKCTREDCFACNKGQCKSLKKPITDKPCPFYKTQEQLDAEDQAATDRLTRIGRTDLIEKYITGGKEEEC